VKLKDWNQILYAHSALVSQWPYKKFKSSHSKKVLSSRDNVEGSFFHCMENHSLVLIREIHGELILIWSKCGSISWVYIQLPSRKIHAHTSLYNTLHHNIGGISCDRASIHACLIRGDKHWTLQINQGALWVCKALFY